MADNFVVLVDHSLGIVSILLIGCLFGVITTGPTNSDTFVFIIGLVLPAVKKRFEFLLK